LSWTTLSKSSHLDGIRIGQVSRSSKSRDISSIGMISFSGVGREINSNPALSLVCLDVSSRVQRKLPITSLRIQALVA
jgi:hypothetical protein